MVEKYQFHLGFSKSYEQHSSLQSIHGKWCKYNDQT